MSDRKISLSGEEATIAIAALERYSLDQRKRAKLEPSRGGASMMRRTGSIALELAQRVRLAS